MNRIVSYRFPGGMNGLEITLLIAVGTMPFMDLLNSYAIVLFGAASLLSSSPAEKLRLLRNRGMIWIVLPVSYFLWMAISLIWDRGSELSKSAWRIMESSSSWVVFPVLFATIERIQPKSLKKIFYVFIISNLAASFYCLWQAYLEYQSSNYINVFFYYHLSMHVGLSAIYFSLYCIFCIYILVFYLLFRKPDLWRWLICFLITAYLTFFIVLLSSKAMLFLLYVSALIFTIYSFFHFRSKWGSLIISLFLIAMPLLIAKFPYVKARLEETQFKSYTGPTDNQNGFAVRGVLWSASWDLISIKPIFGWGQLGAQDALRKKYIQVGFKEGALGNYGSHNQYLFSWVMYGLIGLGIFLAYITNLLLFFVRHKNFLGVCLVILFMLANITESMLEVQKGIVFFFLFGNLLMLSSRSNKLTRTS